MIDVELQYGRLEKLQLVEVKAGRIQLLLSRCLEFQSLRLFSGGGKTLERFKAPEGVFLTGTPTRPGSEQRASLVLSWPSLLQAFRVDTKSS